MLNRSYNFGYNSHLLRLVSEAVGAAIKSKHQSFLCQKSPSCHLLRRVGKLLSHLKAKHTKKDRVLDQLFLSPSNFQLFTYSPPPALRSNQQQSWWLRGNYGDGKWASSSQQFHICDVRPEHILRAAVMTGVWEEWLICRPHQPLLRGT